MEHCSKLHRGRHKTLAEHRAAVAKQKGQSSPEPAEKKPTTRQLTSANPPATGDKAMSKMAEFLKKRNAK